MFGFDNKAGADPAAAQQPTGAPTVPSDNGALVPPPIDTPLNDSSSSFDAGADEGTMNDDMTSNVSSAPVDGSSDQSAAPASTFHAAPEDTTTTDSSSNTTASPMSNDDLLHLKQQALQQLSPLVGHLDQSPEEKFKTTMMMIQASDDQSLVPSAYEAANAITDEKVKAQALLDIVNEINYFTQHHQN